MAEAASLASNCKTQRSVCISWVASYLRLFVSFFIRKGFREKEKKRKKCGLLSNPPRTPHPHSNQDKDLQKDKYKDKDTQTNTKYFKDPMHCNVCYIFEKQGVQEYQIWHFIPKFSPNLFHKINFNNNFLQTFPTKTNFHLSTHRMNIWVWHSLQFTVYLV